MSAADLAALFAPLTGARKMPHEARHPPEGLGALARALAADRPCVPDCRTEFVPDPTLPAFAAAAAPSRA